MKFAFKYLFTASILICANSYAGDVMLREVGGGFKKVRLTQQARNEIFESNKNEAAEIDSNIRTKTDYDVIIIDSYEGLFNSGIPEWAIRDYLDDAGVSWADATGKLKFTKIEQVSFDLQALKELTVGNSERFPETSTNNEGGLCRKKWKTGTKSVSKTISTQNRSFDKNIANSSFYNLAINGDAMASGSLQAVVEYRTKKNTCIGIPYKAELVKSTFDAKLNVSADAGLTGKALVAYKKNLFNEYMKFFDYSQGWWVYVFYISVDLEVGMDIGANLDASLTANLDSGFKLKGAVDARYECVKGRCSETRKNGDFDLTPTTYANYSAQLDIILTPYADLAMKANVDLYKIFELGEVKLGLAAGLPIRYFGYIGNMCSDANNDGKNERVTASIFDITAQSYMYLQYETFLSSKKTSVLNLNPFGWVKTKDSVTFGPATGSNTVYVKNILFKNLGGDDIFTPVVTFKDPLALKNGSISLAKRSCYPFSVSPIYEVDFGDGSKKTTSKSSVLHSWTSEGNKIIKARIVGDEAGRSFNSSKWTARPATVSGSTPGTVPSGGKVFEFNDPVLGNTPKACSLVKIYSAGGGYTEYSKYQLTCPGDSLQVEVTKTGSYGSSYYSCKFGALPKTDYSVSGSCTNWRVYKK